MSVWVVVWDGGRPHLRRFRLGGVELAKGDSAVVLLSLELVVR